MDIGSKFGNAYDEKQNTSNKLNNSNKNKIFLDQIEILDKIPKSDEEKKN